MADMKSNGPINQDFVDRQTKSSMQKLVDGKASVAQAGMQVKTDLSNAMRNNAAITKFTAAQSKNIKSIQESRDAELTTTSLINALEERRARLMAAQSKVTKSNNKELMEHYKELVAVNVEQISHLKATVKLETTRLKVVTSLTQLENKDVGLKSKAKKLSESEVTLLERSRSELARINTVLVARNRVEKVAVANSKSIAEAKKLALKSDKDRQAYADRLERSEERPARNKQRKSVGQTRPSVNEDVGNEDQDNSHQSGESSGKSGVLGYIAGAAGKGVAGVAGAIAGFSGYEMVKTSLKSLSNASDMATESQYHFGTSLDRVDKGVGAYVDRTKKIIDLNSNIGLSFVRMGLSADEAADILPKLLTTSGVALKAFQDSDTKKLETMAKAAGAFSRQTGLSVEDAAQLQNNLIAIQGKTADQAADDLSNITGSIQGMNNSLQDAGFTGAMLNIGEFANMAKEASENTEDLAFNVSDYSKRLASAARNVRLMGATEKEAQKFAAAKGKLYEQKNDFVDMQVGQKILDTLQGEYSEQIKSGDAASITKSLVEKHKLSESQAELAASMLVSKKPIPMLANQMAGLLRGSEISRSSIDSTLEKWFKKTGITSIKDVAAVANDQVLMKELGLEWNNPNDMLTAVDYAKEYLIKHNLEKPDPELAKRMDKLRSDEEYQTGASKEASAGKLEKNAPPTAAKVGSHAQNYMGTHPLSSGTLGVLGMGAAGIGVLGYATRKLSKLGEKLVALQTGKSAESAVVDAAIENAGKAAGKSALQEGEGVAVKSLSKRILPMLAKSFKRSLPVMLGVGALAGAGWAYNKFSGEPESTETTNNGLAPKPEYDYLNQTTGEKAGQSVANAGVGAGTMLGGKYLLGKIAPKFAEKQAAKTVAKVGSREIPLIGGLISGAITGMMTDGPLGRKIFAGIGDGLGTLAGQAITGGVGGAVAGTVLGEGAAFGGTSLYDWMTGEDNNSKLNTDGSLARTGKLDSTGASQAGTAVQKQNTGNNASVVGASVGSFGSTNADGSVDMIINARVRNFVPAVAQANTQTYARQSQFSGAQK